ncbi:MAG: hypothetical protein AB7R67_23790 [Vicinamibacterales bacterium]
MSTPEALDLTVARGTRVEVFTSQDRVGLDLTNSRSVATIDLCPQSAHDVAVGMLRCAIWLNDPASQHPTPDGAIYVSPSGRIVSVMLSDRVPRRAFYLSVSSAGLWAPGVRTQLNAQEALQIALALLAHSADARFELEAGAVVA